MATEFKSACCYMVPARIVKELVPPALAQKLKDIPDDAVALRLEFSREVCQAVHGLSEMGIRYMEFIDIDEDITMISVGTSDNDGSEPRPSTSGEASSAGPRWPKTEQPEGTGIRPYEIIIPAGAEDDVELMRQLYSTL